MLHYYNLPAICMLKCDQKKVKCLNNVFPCLRDGYLLQGVVYINISPQKVTNCYIFINDSISSMPNIPLATY